MNCKQCGKCGAKWMRLSEDSDWQLYWATGKPGKEEDLAGLVCNNLGDEQCINPKRGNTTGDTWEKRDDYARKQEEEWNKRKDS